MAENPDTWDEIDKAISTIIEEHDEEITAGICGNTLPVKLGNYVRMEIAVRVAERKLCGFCLDQVRGQK